MPEPVQQDMGTALHWAQAGGVDPKGRFRGPLHPDARPMKGKTLGGVIEVAVDHAGDTYRVMYAGLAGRLYVLHAFQKKSTRGRRTPQREIELIEDRLAVARQLARKEVTTQ